MKKLLLLSALLGASLCASAALPVAGHKLPGRSDMSSMTIDASTVAAIKDNKAPRKAAATKMDYTVADEPYYAIGFNNAKKGDKASMAFELTPEAATVFAGNKISAVTFYQGLRSSGSSAKNYIKEAEVFLTYDLQDTPFATAAATTTTAAWDYITVELAEPYEIEAGKGLYIGVTSTLTNASDYAIVVDYMMHSDDIGGWVAANGEWDNVTDYYGFCCVGAVIEGDNLPQNFAAVTDIDALPYYTAGEPFTIDAYIRNNGAAPISSLELSVKCGNDEAQVQTVTAEEIGIGDQFTYGRSIGLSLRTIYSQSGPNVVPITVTITKVNGVDNGDPSASYSTGAVFLPADKAFDRTVVIEEFTGTWCGWCPRGIVGMEYMAENYTRDQVIGIAAHYGDEMQVESYDPIVNAFASGFPGSAINRMATTDPDKDNLVYYYDLISSIPTHGKVTGTATYNEDETAITFNTTSTFAFDYSAPSFTLEYVIIEDNVGPYTQTNNYAGGSYGEMGGWENKGSSARNTYYNEVARLLDSADGVPGSVPANITAGQNYDFTYELAIPKVVKDKEKMHLIVLLVDTNNGTIVNAHYFDKVMGTTDIAADNADAPVEYYNLQGIRVANPENGLFIRRQGDRVEKIVK